MQRVIGDVGLEESLIWADTINWTEGVGECNEIFELEVLREI